MLQDQTTAKDAYAQRQDAIWTQIDTLCDNVHYHAERCAKPNWADVGDLGIVIELLGKANKFLADTEAE